MAPFPGNRRLSRSDARSFCLSQPARLTRTFRCHLCPQSVNTAQGLKSHITRKHPKQDEENQSSSTASSSPTVQEPPNPDPDVPLATLLGQLRSSIRVLRRIPKGARSAAATALSDTIDNCLSGGTPEMWERLLLFSAICLQVPAKREADSASLTSLVKQNITDFLAGKTLSCSSRPRNSWRPPSSPASRSSYVQAKLSDGDVRGAVRLLGSEDSFAPVNPATLEALIAHHPVPDPDVASPSSVLDPQHAPFRVSESAVAGAISSFPAGSAGGLDFLRPQHLKDLTSHSAGAAGIRLLSSITKLCNTMFSGGIPEVIRPVLYGAALCALTKSSGGIRPIAIGCTFRRLAAKLCSFHLSSKFANHLQPVQFGFGTKRGIEIATHLARRYVSQSYQEPKVFLKVDFRNAFNSLHRFHILECVASHCPELYQFTHQCYGSASSLVYGDHIIPSVRGVQQGDPLGPALFCLALHPVASSSLSELNLWYLDDGSLGGAQEVVFQDFSTLVGRSAELGLDINTSKCELFCLGSDASDSQATLRLFQTVAPDIKLLPLSDCTQLGTPLFPSALPAYLDERTDTLRLISSRLPEIPAHCAFYILKNSQAIPKLTHILRCAPTWVCPESLDKFDNMLREALCSVTNVSLSDAAWSQSSWPVSSGGLGIRHAKDLSLPAFLSSTYGSLEQTDRILSSNLTFPADEFLASGLAAWKSSSHSPPPPNDSRHLQREWERPLVENSIRSAFEQACTPLDKARLIGVSSPESGAFLNTLPSSALGTLLDDNSFRISVALRLGANICQPHTCVCGSSVSESGLHGLCCRRSAGRISRHSSVNDVIHRALTSAGIPSSLEPSHLSLESNIRPDGVTQIPWSEGKSLVWDFTCTDGLAPSHVDFSSAEPLYAASVAERNKHSKYAYLAQSHIFVPVAIECLGSVGREGLEFLRAVGKRITASTGEKQATAFLLQRISVAVQRGNARAILGTLPSSASLDECISVL